ncbi:MAG: hypothetical protein ACLQVF_46635 [Isosphaeraceae bacterium]
MAYDDLNTTLENCAVGRSNHAAELRKQADAKAAEPGTNGEFPEYDRRIALEAKQLRDKAATIEKRVEFARRGLLYLDPAGIPFQMDPATPAIDR